MLLLLLFAALSAIPSAQGLQSPGIVNVKASSAISRSSMHLGNRLPLAHACLSHISPTRSGKSLLACSASSQQNKPYKVIIAGAPASGKGTQCELITRDYGLVHLSTGDMLRAAVAAGNELGRQAQSFMDSGKLVPDELVIALVKERLTVEDCQTNGWLLDGFPRTQAQAQALEAAGVRPDVVVYLDVPDSALVERVVGRRQDPQTGKIYHMKFKQPETEEIAARLTQRADDTEEKVMVRVKAFHQNMGAIKQAYASILKTIPGDDQPENIYKQISTTLQDATVS